MAKFYTCGAAQTKYKSISGNISVLNTICNFKYIIPNNLATGQGRVVDCFDIGDGCGILNSCSCGNYLIITQDFMNEFVDKG